MIHKILGTGIAVMLAGAATAPCHAAESQNGTGETDGYRLVWQDLFDGTELNRNRWNVEVNGNGGGNAELQYYTDRECNVHVGDDGQGNGCLILTAIREKYQGKEFTSGRVTTQKLFAFKHGKIEAAIKMPSTANGLWPAFWMMGNDHKEVGWPKSGETDIVEMGHQNAFGPGTQDRYFNGAMHWGQGWPACSYAHDNTKSYSLQDGEFHIFTVIWDEDKVRMYVDLDKTPKQTPYFQMNITQDNPDDENSPGNYFHKENFILFNVAVGGNFPGIHNAEGITALNDENNHQASMYVNYVKVYQKGTGDESISMTVPGDDIEGSGVISPSLAGNLKIRIESGHANCEGADLKAYDASGRLMGAGRDTLDLSRMGRGLVILSARDDFGNKTVLKEVL